MTPELCLFDLDGTLTDPAEGITNSILYALREMGAETPERKTLYRFIGPPLAESFREFFPEERVEEAIQTYRVYFQKQGMFENVVYPGVPEMLRGLRAAGVPIAVATSKPEEFAVTILEHFGLAENFAVVGGASMDDSRNDKTSVVRYTLERLRIAPSPSVVMIGDRKYDVEGAKAVGITPVGVAWGYGSREELLRAGAETLVESPEELLSALLQR